FKDPITVEKIVGDNGMIIQPRCKKTAEEQTRRAKDKAEVFTPSWVCNAQNNLVDEAWFGRKNIFNSEVVDENGKHTWITNTEPITEFPEGKTWKDYVKDTRMEITCGEAPYLASRYDATTGEYIPTSNRIGLLDRKLRLISENCDKSDKWLDMAKVAYHNIYGFEWQGDNLLLARESLLLTFMEFYFDKFKKNPPIKSIDSIAYIISWNIWQMDGLLFVIPNSCHDYEKVTKIQASLFEEAKEIRETCHCEGCQNKDNNKHNGIYAVIRDWDKHSQTKKRKDGTCGRDECDMRFIDFLNEQKKNKNTSAI
ncbi:MAG: restriction endonuclease subunit M, partial [Bacteroidaceae bacterium]|nr:restriction endonuclease subunit M [Bacteroidaceae bacterium]